MAEHSWMIAFNQAGPVPPRPTAPDDGRLRAAMLELVAKRSDFVAVEEQIRALAGSGVSVDVIAVRGGLPSDTVRRVLAGEDLEAVMLGR